MLKKKKKRVVIGMSGGVDSAVAAALLLKQGYDVTGVFMQFWFPQGVTYGENRCCSLESFNQAKEVADNLGIKIHKLNVGKEFKAKIVDEFISDYAALKTPNPCVSCNKFIKFDLFLKKSLTLFDADYIATGHYAQVKKVGRKFKLLRGKDENKDQSYFLYNLDQNALKHVLFPLGKYNKPQIRKIAKKMNMAIHAKKDSQEICFVGKSHSSFLSRYLNLKPGKIVDENGKEIGKHNGLQLYTVGQRKGIGLAGGPWFVTGIDKTRNLLIVTNDPEKSKIFSPALQCHKLNWVAGEPKFPFKCQAQIRYRSKPEKCKVTKVKDEIFVEFIKPQRAVAAGQSIVFYKKQEVIGGGVIK
ncbi:tRNA 2-thiouridine(34) synthase MnmA [Candidatus Falkowbacteria bacterium]|uniref:tRNA-specific 2-thiouridylase MnmA n=1 Tax=Candidatus Buchananbacteria bacterium CG10_big_fil_rev_8_21_14_0_10_33_19 TaxID=1974525 RepID=A0A2H0W3T5_9BACT|nr:tRNA 2-thiouridine(34) synthase MnmA [Candidatus Falkowbacteria bacterium]PIS05937.1 MAG: tRNA 2-thiouridine(34) synthase MnmA [Candidatus Buchananbacteria bacterium CG10_big_fil_rev_8_21_14_0_10_33_19]